MLPFACRRLECSSGAAAEHVSYDVLLLQGWGGARAVQQRKLWARVATVLHAPQTMTNRSSKMAQLWKVHHFEVLVGKDAAAAGIVQPRAEKDGSAMLNHDIVTLWPACVIGGTDQPPRKRGRPRKNSLRELHLLCEGNCRAHLSCICACVRYCCSHTSAKSLVPAGAQCVPCFARCQEPCAHIGIVVV